MAMKGCLDNNPHMSVSLPQPEVGRLVSFFCPDKKDSQGPASHTQVKQAEALSHKLTHLRSYK